MHANDAADQQFQPQREDGEYRVRAAARCADQAAAQRIVDEVLALYCCGPAAGGGVRQSVTGQVSTASILLPREPIEQAVQALLVPASGDTNQRQPESVQ